MSMKRKAASLASNAGTPDPKRRRLPTATAQESPESVKEVGSAFLAQLNEARDKKNRPITAHFLTLPNKHEFPDYYDVITLPVAFDTIEGKLDRLEYPTLSALESDIKRLISNAKQYNDRNSEVHSDAEKIRKMAATMMQKINPAYEDPSYAPVPTPLPDDEAKEESPSEQAGDGMENGTPEATGGKTSLRLKLRGPSERSSAPSERPSGTDGEAKVDASDLSFEGKTFQAAQQDIVQALMGYEDEEGNPIASPFLNLPPRDLRDYYTVIKHPVSLKGALKSVRGIRGRDKPTGVSFFKSWPSFEEEIRHIWSNARTYNEDGSEISQYANELESYFREILSRAKQAVPGPAQPHIKLHVGAREAEPSPKIKLSFNAKAAPTGANGIAVDAEALKRQNEVVQAAMNGSVGNPPSGSPQSSLAAKVASPSPAPGMDSIRSPTGDRPAPKVDGTAPTDSARPADQVMTDATPDAREGSGPTPGRDQRAASSSMPPPAMRPPSGSGSTPHAPSLPVRQPLPQDHFHPQAREPGKGVDAALIQQVLLYSPSDANSAHYGKFRLLPNPRITHNGLHIYLDRRQTYFVLELRHQRADPSRALTFSVQVDDALLQQTQRPPPNVQAQGPIWMFNLDSNVPITHRINILCSSCVGRGPGAGTPDEREMRWFHIDYWP